MVGPASVCGAGHLKNTPTENAPPLHHMLLAFGILLCACFLSHGQQLLLCVLLSAVGCALAVVTGRERSRCAGCATVPVSLAPPTLD